MRRRHFGAWSRCRRRRVAAIPATAGMRASAQSVATSFLPGRKLVMLNRVELVGHLGADPEIRRTTDGRPVANLRIATSERWTDKTTGEKKEQTEWHRVTVLNENHVEVCEKYLKKGARV